MNNNKVIAFLARDKDNKLYLFHTKDIDDIYKYKDKWCFYLDPDGFEEIPENLFPEVKWEDEKPTKVNLIIEL